MSSNHSGHKFHTPHIFLFDASLSQKAVPCSSSASLHRSIRTEDSADPPFESTYKNLLNHPIEKPELSVVEEWELPLIDLNELNLGDSSRRACKKKIARASREWGFFQVINHGISREVLERMREEQMKLFSKPFWEKSDYKDSNFSEGRYRWGTPSATCLQQLSWSEAFHVSLNDVLGSRSIHNSLSSIMEQFATTVSELSQKLVEILASELGQKSDFFKEKCVAGTCYLRLNRYPPCPIYPQMFGIMPHTDTDFITVLRQDHIGGLQLVKDGNWFAVKPNNQALVINIGDLFQAWSNNVYKSVEHRVVANPHHQRFSTAYFVSCVRHTTPLYRATWNLVCIEALALESIGNRSKKMLRFLDRKLDSLGFSYKLNRVLA